MKKDFKLFSLMVMGLLFLIGIVFIFSSLSIGQHAASVAIENRGGMMDSADYERIINTTILNFQLVGVLCSLFGGIGVIISGYIWLTFGVRISKQESHSLNGLLKAPGTGGTECKSDVSCKDNHM